MLPVYARSTFRNMSVMEVFDIKFELLMVEYGIL